MSLLDPALNPIRVAVGAVRELGRDATAAAADAAGRGGLAALDVVLASPYTDEALQRLLESPAAERAVGYALRGPLVDALARDMERHDVVDRLADGLLAGDALDRVFDRLLAQGIADRLADRLLEGPELERVVTHALESRLLDTIVDRLLETRELWVLVEEIARSPAVTEAIGQQGVGFAGQVAGQVRVRSQGADARLERVARRLLRRKAQAADRIAEPGSP